MKRRQRDENRAFRDRVIMLRSHCTQAFQTHALPGSFQPTINVGFGQPTAKLRSSLMNRKMKLYTLLVSLIYAGVLYDKNDDVELYQLENLALYENPHFFDEEIFKYQLKDKIKVEGDCTATGTDCSHEHNVIKRELTAIICSQEFLHDVIKDGTCEIISEYFYQNITQKR